MNKVILTGRLTKDPTVRYSQGDNPSCVANFTLAVNRKYSKDNEQTADFINCVAFGKTGEFAEKYAKKGMKFDVCGRIQTRNYKNKDNQTVYVTEVVIEDMEFGESKKSQDTNGKPADDDFVNVPDDEIDYTLPFN